MHYFPNAPCITGYVRHDLEVVHALLPLTLFRPSSHLVPLPPPWGLAYAQIVETSFTELAVSFLDFHLESHR